MNTRNLKILLWWVMLAVGLWLTASLFYTSPIQNTLLMLRRADYRPAIPVLAVTIAVHVLRARRWALLLQEDDRKVPVTTALSAIVTGYFVNIFVPRLGEITRCVSLTGHTGIPVTKAIGTVAAERITDLICLALTFALALVVQYDLLSGIFSNYFLPFFNNMLAQKHWLPYASVAALAMAAGALWWASARSTRHKSATARWVIHFNAGLVAPLKKSGINEYLLLTLLIWTCYFLMTFLWFKCFESTSVLGWHAGLAVMVMGSLAKTVPIQAGGMGAYHVVITATFMLFAIPEATGLALAVIIHGFQLGFALLAGISVLGANALVSFLKKNEQPAGV